MREKAEKPAKRKLTRAERKQIEAVIRQAKGDGKAHTVQDSIPFQNMFPDGLCRLEGGAFSKTIAFEDVNYRLAGPEDQRSIFESLCDFYNGYDPSIGVQVSLDSRSGGSAADEMFGIRRQGNDLDPIRDEAVDILRMQYKRGNNGYVKTKYVTLTIEAENLPAARARFARIETDTLNRFKVMGAAAHVLDGKERLELLYNILHPEGGQFAFEWDWLPASGLSVKDFISPSSFHFGETRTFRIGKRYGAVSFLQILAPEMHDRKKTLHNPESEWKIFDNTHEAIWTEAIADAARLARQTRRRPTKMGEMGMFSGMMFCADCGSIMYQCRATNFRRDQEYYLCSGYRKSRDVCGQTHSIRTVILEELVLQNLREIVSFASQRKDDFVKMVMDADMRQRNRGLAKRQKTLADAEKRIAELDTIFKRLYEDTISGKLSDERFQKLSADYEKEQHELQELAAVLRGEIEAEERKSANVERFLSVVERYTEIPELTPCILHEFVEKIVVHAASDPKGKNRTQEIDIYYKGIGALEVSKVTSSRQE